MISFITATSLGQQNFNVRSIKFPNKKWMSGTSDTRGVSYETSETGSANRSYTNHSVLVPIELCDTHDYLISTSTIGIFYSATTQEFDRDSLDAVRTNEPKPG